MDFGLKEGETFSMNLQGVDVAPQRQTGKSGGLKKLAPPPGHKKKVADLIQTSSEPQVSLLDGPA